MIARLNRCSPAVSHIARVSLLALSLGAAGLSTSARAQDRMVADSVNVTPSQLIALGNVVMFIDGSRISAHSIEYNRQNRALKIIGPAHIATDDGTIVSAKNGIIYLNNNKALLSQVKALIEGRIQVVAAQANRSGPLYALHNAALTSCQTCPGQAPLWEVRSSQITYSDDADRIWLAPGSIAIRGTSIIPTPAFSIPTPEVSRAQGWLMPRFERSNESTQLKLRYFIPFGPHHDVTLTPYLGRNSSLGLRWRAGVMFDTPLGAARGNVNLQLQAANSGGWGKLDAALSLPNHWQLTADWEIVTNADFLDEYTADTRNQLDSAVRLEQITPRRFTRLRYTTYTPLKFDMAALQHPIAHGAAQFELRHPIMGGFAYGNVAATRIDYNFDHLSSGDFAQDHLSGDIGWRGRYIVGPGLEVALQGGIRAGTFGTTVKAALNQSNQHQTGQWSAGYGQAALAWPLALDTATTQQIITPKLSFNWAESYGDRPRANAPEHDLWHINQLHNITPIVGYERMATGRWADISLHWYGQNNSGQTAYAEIGKTIRLSDPQSGAQTGSGTAYAPEGWVLAMGSSGSHYRLAGQMHIDQRVLASELSAALFSTQAGITLRHSFNQYDPLRIDQNIHIGGWWQANEKLRLTASTAYDLYNQEANRARIGVNWQNECVNLSLSASHHFASSINTVADTDFEFTISIDGFSASPEARALRSCRK